MKRAMNFRLSKQAVSMLFSLSETLEMTKTEIVEDALQKYFEKSKLGQHSPLSEFAGTLDDADANQMLESIYSDRVNKDKDIKL